MSRRIVLIAACCAPGAVLLVFLLNRTGASDTVGDWRGDTQPLAKQLGFVSEVEGCRWRLHRIAVGGGLVPGPPEVVLEGVAQLSAEGVQRATAAFQWAPISSPGDTQEMAAIAADAGFAVEPARLVMAANVSKGLSGVSTFMDGELYLDPVSRVLMFKVRKS